MARVLIALAAALVLGGCGDGDSSAGAATIVAGFYPLEWAADHIAADDVEVVNLTPPGAEPHDLELSPLDVERIAEATAVLYVGGGFQQSLEDAVRGRDDAVDLLELVEPLDLGHGQPDPHVWLDPGRFARVVAGIGDALGETEAAAALSAELEALDAEFRRGLSECERREIVTSHAAFGYLADAYGLEQIALSGLGPEAEPTPRELEALAEDVRETRATTVFYESLASPRVAQTVAREAGARTELLDPLEGLADDRLAAGADYLSAMRENLDALRRALGCR